MPTTGASRIARLFSLAGMLLVFATTAGTMFVSPGAIAFLVWALLPYIALWFMPRLTPNRWTITGAGAVALTVEAGVRASAGRGLMREVVTIRRWRMAGRSRLDRTEIRLGTPARR